MASLISSVRATTRDPRARRKASGSSQWTTSSPGSPRRRTFLPRSARKTVALIADFIQREAAEDGVKELFDKAPELQAIIASGAPTGGEGMGLGLKGLMGIAAGAMGGGGLMALGGQLMTLGLSMDQVQAAGREVFAYAREVAGDQTVGEIAASIPGLSQFI